MKKATLLFLPSLFTAILNAQGIPGQRSIKKIDELIASSYPSIAPGDVVLISEKGKVIFEKAFGRK